MNFEARIFGKCILAGEHAVIRGGPAVVFPVRSKSLDITYQSGTEDLNFVAEGESGASEMNLVFWSLMERALKLSNRRREELKGKLRVRNSIPLSAGLGASSAVCVAVARWFQAMGWIPEAELFSFSRNLEDLFHGESSGVDIAAALEGRAIHFERGKPFYIVNNLLQPHLFLSFSGGFGKTSDCVQKVKQLHERDSRLGQEIDQEMIRASLMTEQALGEGGETGLKLLSDALTKARTCFERWGLVEGALDEHMVKLMSQGALAVKPTGSGGGGYVLSLWRKPPMLDHLIST